MAAFSFPKSTNFFSTATILTQPKPTFASSTKVRMSLQENGPSMAVVGVTGAVGHEFLSVLSDRNFPYRSIKMLASKRSAGRRLTFEEREHVIEELTPQSFDGVDIALFSAGGSISREFGPIAVERGTIVVDNSSAFRMDENVPLVIPEVNPEAMDHIKLGMGTGALIANPNCSTIICLVAATPLHRRAKVLRMVVSTYQAASGAGAAAMEELELQTREVLEGRPPTCKIFKQQDTARDILKNAAGVAVIDDRESNHFPTPLEVSSKDDVAVGRIRCDMSQDGNLGLDMFVCGDQIRKGAALNAIQIAEMLL
ncbi:uncharacterized protein LOC129284356 isoform X3 [Prosopis cineraria]|uniref:uncharacterized protein LOC129284356 isoform X3 n=1 Tax=Prosopis cineraria TaxID=364024 RepID=UPI00240FDAC5|nr:uncharacterized protein LOC129284356 isoform X3 [Prosopis cineraria]